METKCLIPEQCFKCKNLFDLKYDLTCGDDGFVAMCDPLCWKCRVISFFSQMTGKSEELREDEKFDDGLTF